ncbi:MAG: hypothetical protein AMJ91_04220 [candidate division Zixibacteria bacterium SM23_73_3]|nr:MAG: hypothetical protein AMJ91_04220 [candidate division Zixibacteria bacterium SM23_73_3]
MKRILIGLFLACLFLSLFVSCGKRDNPVRPRYLFNDPWQIGRSFPSLQGNLMGDSPVKEVFIYLPPQYDPVNHPPQSLNGFAVLYLLHDFGGDYETFISVYKVAQIADQLIAEGQIQPMIIVMPDASSISLASDPLKKEKAGTFYTNSALLGRYEDYILHEIIDTIEANFATVGTRVEGQWIPDKAYHAISGHGMGGYGALKIAMDYDTLFASVSAMSPFTSFESFLSRDIIDKVFEENGIDPDDISYSSYKSLSPWSDSQHPDKPYSHLVFAMAAAFSYHDPADPDNSNFFSLTEIAGKKYGVDLPFDSSRTIPPGSAIWYKWLIHDLKTKLINDPSGFGDMSIHFDCGDQDQLNLLDGVEAFDQLLSLYGKEHTYKKYSGYPNYPADHDNFIYDRLPEILKFHSRHFGPPKWER